MKPPGGHPEAKENSLDLILCSEVRFALHYFEIQAIGHAIYEILCFRIAEEPSMAVEWSLNRQPIVFHRLGMISSKDDSAGPQPVVG